jgi:hypothetical protein
MLPAEAAFLPLRLDRELPVQVRHGILTRPDVETLGSTAHFLVWGLQNCSSFRPSWNRSVLVSPGRSDTR